MDFLAKFKRIGWDVDDTLIGSRHAGGIADYIRRNPFDQRHYIITFRSHGLQCRVFSDLQAYGLDQTHCVSLNNCSDAIYEAQGVPYREWKGAVCAELGIEVLVDDDTENVAAGCNKHGIAHIHPDHLSIILSLLRACRAQLSRTSSQATSTKTVSGTMSVTLAVSSSKLVSCASWRGRWSR